ncbi:hypothetical protein BGZ96_007986 [Linnemannia gamsii]|uniref:JmjC domain-containing protein n=1 Tax=Linnemannia gamsii TaxID=64522 RepID=A0ABQ7JZZ1_9FUNG|nr:hypothetical protein BGZ96_007986 [Linnemannia gamsii]
MMQSALRPEGQVQTSVDSGPMVYESIMARGYPFVPVKRVNVNDSGVNLEYEVQSRCVDNGEPVVLEGFHLQEKWDADLFTFPYLQAKLGDEKILCRDLHNADDVDLTMAQYIESVHGDTVDSNLASSSTCAPTSILGSQDSLRSRRPLLYAKDLTCPPTWRNFLMNGGLPPFLAYMRENDLNNLNTELAAENLMVYIGQAGTWTPAHIDQCGAIGHNIMTWADNDSSSIWFMIRSNDRKKAEELWSSFGQPLDYEGYFAGLHELQHAKFPIYVVQQKVGDFVMVPSQCVHQVVNLGKATIKVSWNRLTPNCLKAAMTSVLPRYRQIGRPEGYRIKVIIASTLKAWTDKLETQEGDFGMPKDNFSKAFKEVLELYKGIVEEEWVDLDAMGSDYEPFERPKRLKESQHSQPAICDFCQADIWNRQFQCRKCVDEVDAYDLCARCFSLGRCCEHREDQMDFVENFSMESCRLAYCRALAAWNQSTALSGCPSHKPIANTWFKKTVAGCAPPEASHAKSLWFTRPEDDCRNYGGVCDNLGPFEQENVGLGEDVWIERPQIAHGSHISKRTKLRPVRADDMSGTGAFQRRRSLVSDSRSTITKKGKRSRSTVDDVDDEEWKAKPKVIRGPLTKRNKLNAAHVDDQSDTHIPSYYTRTLITKTQAINSRKIRTRSFRPRTTSEAFFAATLGEEEEFVRTFAVKAGLTRTLASLSTLHLAAGMNAYDVFEMDKRCASLDPGLRANFRADLLEKKHQAHFREELVVNEDALGAKQSQRQLKGRVEATREDVACEAGHRLQSDGEAREETPRRKRNQKRVKEKEETTPEDAAGVAANPLQSDEEAHTDALNKKRLQKRLKEKGETTHKDGTEEPGHQLHSDEGTYEDAPSKKRLQKRLKEEGETTHEAVAGKIRHHLQSDEEEREDTPNKKRSQKRLKEKEEMTPEGATGKVKHHLLSDEEAHGSIPNGKQPQNRLKNKGRAREDNASEDRHQSRSDVQQEENTHENNVDGKRPQKHGKEKEEGAREIVAGDDQDRDIPPAAVKRKGAVSSQHPSRTRKLNGDKESLRRSPSPGASRDPGREDEDSRSPPVSSSRSKRGQVGATATLPKSETKSKSPESKKAAIPRRTSTGFKKQIGFLRGTLDIPNHSFTKAEPHKDTGTRAATEIGTVRSEKANNTLGSSRIVGPRTIDDGDDKDEEVEAEAGVSHVALLFEPQAEDSSAEDKTFQEANTSVEAVTMSHETSENAEGAFQKTIELIKETSLTFQETSSTTRETTFIIQETTPSLRIQTTRAKKEQKPQVDGAIITATDMSHSTRSATTANGSSNNNVGAVQVTHSTKTTANTTTMATATTATNDPDTIATTVRKGPIKIVRSSPSQTIVKEIVDNSIKASPKLSAITAAAAAQEQPISYGKTEQAPKSLLSSSSSLTPVSLISISSTEPSVSRHDDAMATPIASKAGGRSHRFRVEESSASSNIHTANTEEPTIGRRRRMNSRS